jgi:hypothetical protein
MRNLFPDYKQQAMIYFFKDDVIKKHFSVIRIQTDLKIFQKKFCLENDKIERISEKNGILDNMLSLLQAYEFLAGYACLLEC